MATATWKTPNNPYSAYITRSKVGTNTPQQEAIPGETQVENNAGGFVYQISPMKQLDRFLILGTIGGTYYVGEKKLTVENALVVKKLVEEDGVAVVQRVVEIASSNRAPKADPALFTLALAITYGDARTKRAVVQALPHVARIGTHLFSFVEYASNMRGWGRVLREAVANWYTRHSEVD